jgi:hypothetical protein
MIAKPGGRVNDDERGTLRCEPNHDEEGRGDR